MRTHPPLTTLRSGEHRMRRVAVALAFGLVATLLAPATASAFYGNGAQIVSADFARGEQGDDATVFAAISADGRYVAIQTRARNFFADDDPDPPGKYRAGGIFRFDLETRALEKVADGNLFDEETNAFLRRGAVSPSISADGRYVAFATAEPLLPVDTNDNVDVYVRDMQKAIGEPGAFDLVSARNGSDVPSQLRQPDHLSRQQPRRRSIGRGGDQRRRAESRLPHRGTIRPAGERDHRHAFGPGLRSRSRRRHDHAGDGEAQPDHRPDDRGTRRRRVRGRAERRRHHRCLDRRQRGRSDPSAGRRELRSPIRVLPLAAHCRRPDGADPAHHRPRRPRRCRLPSRVDDLLRSHLDRALLRAAGRTGGAADQHQRSAAGSERGRFQGRLPDRIRAQELSLRRSRPGRLPHRHESRRQPQGGDGRADPRRQHRSERKSADQRHRHVRRRPLPGLVTARTKYTLPVLQFRGTPGRFPTVATSTSSTCWKSRSNGRRSSSEGGDTNGDVLNGVTISADGERIAFVSFAGNLFFGDANQRADAFVVERQPDPGNEQPKGTGGGVGESTIESSRGGPQITVRARSRPGGVVELTVSVPAAGGVRAVAKGRAGEPRRLRTLATDDARARGTKRSTVKLVLRPVQRYRGELRELGKLPARAAVTYVAARGGRRASASRAIVFLEGAETDGSKPQK